MFDICAGDPRAFVPVFGGKRAQHAREFRPIQFTALVNVVTVEESLQLLQHAVFVGHTDALLPVRALLDGKVACLWVAALQLQPIFVEEEKAVLCIQTALTTAVACATSVTPRPRHNSSFQGRARAHLLSQ